LRRDARDEIDDRCFTAPSFHGGSGSVWAKAVTQEQATASTTINPIHGPRRTADATETSMRNLTCGIEQA
jgi:hypothetical protein